MNHRDVTEIVFGLLVHRKIDPAFVVADHLWSDVYQEGLRYMQSTSDWNQAGLIDRIGITPITNAEAAVGRIEGEAQSYIEVLELSYRRSYKADVFHREAKKLERGGESDDTKILEVLNTDYNTSIFVRGDEIEEGPQPHRLTYYDPIDKFCGDPGHPEIRGVPEASLIIIAGMPGFGKTTILAQILGNMAKAGKKSLFFSLEMTSKQAVNRIIGTTGVTKDERKNIRVAQNLMTSGRIRAIAEREIARDKDIYAVGIDHAEYAIAPGEVNESAVGQVYKDCAALAKSTGVPVFLIGTLNRLANSGIPRINQIRYSSMAEYAAANIVLLYNPNQTDTDIGKSDQLPIFDGEGYLILGKCRYGFREGGPGAIRVPFDGTFGWGDKAISWVSLSSV